MGRSAAVRSGRQMLEFAAALFFAAYNAHACCRTRPPPAPAMFCHDIPRAIAAPTPAPPRPLTPLRQALCRYHARPPARLRLRVSSLHIRANLRSATRAARRSPVTHRHRFPLPFFFSHICRRCAQIHGRRSDNVAPPASRFTACR